MNNAPRPPLPIYGQVLLAGLRTSVVIAEFDFETVSEAGYVWNESTQKFDPLPGAQPKDKGLPSVGAAVYSGDPTAEVLSLAYDLKDGAGWRTWRPGQEPPVALFNHLLMGKLLEAWNVGFERWIWNNVCVPKYGWPPLPEGQLRCAMAKARAFSLPGALDRAAAVLGTPRKDPEGARLMTKFSKLRNPTKSNPKRRIMPEDEPEEFARYVDYNVQDIVAEAAASACIPDLSPVELEYWQIDQAINVRGVHVDAAAVQSCIAIVKQAHAKYNHELQTLTGGVVMAASELQKLQGWLGAHGIVAQSLDEDTITAILKNPAILPEARRALEIRAAIGSASVKKVFAMANQMTRAHRLHDLFSFHAARTGRPTGNGPQPTNLPNSGPEVYRCPTCTDYFGMHHKTACPWCGLAPREAFTPVEWCAEAVESALRVISVRDLATLEYYFKDAMAAVSGCLRGLFDAGPGHELISSDYTAIEAVVLAQLAGEQWRIDLFKEGGKIYEASGAKIDGVTYEAVLAHKEATGKHHPARKKGKLAELASGYQGWIGAWCAFGADEFMTEPEIKAAILAWRAASPAIVEYWGGQFRRVPGFGLVPELYGIEGAAISAILSPGQWFDCRGIKFIKHGPALYIRLLSGRFLTYHDVRLEPSDRGGYSIAYWGWNSNPKNGPTGWIEIRTWGGRLVENITQATANDVLRFASVNLEAAGYPIVLHVYDEIVSEIPKDSGAHSLAEFEAIMGRLPPWAEGWPIRAAGGWRGPRYRK